MFSSFIDEVGMLVCTTSCKGGKDSVKICTDEGCHKGHLAEWEKAPFFVVVI